MLARRLRGAARRRGDFSVRPSPPQIGNTWPTKQAAASPEMGDELGVLACAHQAPQWHLTREPLHEARIGLYLGREVGRVLDEALLFQMRQTAARRRVLHLGAVSKGFRIEPSFASR